MTKEQISHAIKATPFKPFTVSLADGRRYQVPTADHASVHPTGHVMLVWVDDVAKIIDLATITEIEQSA